MKIIKYYSKAFIKNQITKKKEKKTMYDNDLEEIIEKEINIEIDKPIFKIKSQEYKIKDNECEKWYNIIKKTYGEYGDVTIQEGGEDEKPLEELQAEINAQLLKDSANLQIQLKKQQELNATLLIKIAQLGGNVNA